MVTKKKSNIDMCLFLFLAGGAILALYLRYALMPEAYNDLTKAFSPWYDYIKQHGFAAYKDIWSIANYTPSYLYLLGLASLLPLPNIYAIKIIAICFDFVAALYVYKHIRLLYPKYRYVPAIACMALLFAPTVVVNASMYGQCDIIHTSIILASLYCIMSASNNKKVIVGIFLFGIAASVKMLSLFLLPLYLIICIKKRVSLLSLLLIPLAYIMTIIPSWCAGRNFLELLRIPINQIYASDKIILNAMNVYQFLPGITAFYKAGKIYTASMLFILVMMTLVSVKKEDFNNKVIIRLALIFSLVVPFFAPGIHERYFFIADVLSIVYAFYFPKYFYVPIVINLTSLFSYGAFGLRIGPIPPAIILAFFVLSQIVIVIADFMKTCVWPSPENETLI